MVQDSAPVPTPLHPHNPQQHAMIRISCASLRRTYGLITCYPMLCGTRYSQSLDGGRGKMPSSLAIDVDIISMNVARTKNEVTYFVVPPAATLSR